MSRSNPLFVLAFIASLVIATAHPQTPSAAPEDPPALTGSVTGVVYDEATRLPIRFAEINIVPVPSKTDVASAGNQPTASGAQQRIRGVRRVEGASGIDGSFRLNVPEGDYFVAALKPGYITPGTAEATDFFLPEDQLKSVVASLSQVHVDAGGAASVTLTLHRGAVITGRVRFADGSPAIRVAVGCEALDSVERLAKAMSPSNRGNVRSPLQEALQSLSIPSQASEKPTTDDQGRYRIFGLSPGKYLVATAMFMGQRGGLIVRNDGSMGPQNQYPEMVPVYAPTTFRRKDAKVFEIHGDEQVTDADLTIDPNGVHTIKGRLLATDDHRTPSAMIRLKEVSEKISSRLVGIEDDGTFQIHYLPSGTYTLLIDAYGVPDPAKPGVVPAEYKLVKLTAVVADGDVSVNDVLLVPLKPGEHNDNLLW